MLHSIKKQIIELLVDKQLDPFRIQQQVSDHFWLHLIPILEREFDSISTDDKVIYFDRVEIDLGLISATQINKAIWNQDILEPVKRRINKQIVQEKPFSKSIVAEQSVQVNVYRQWVFYMQHGYLPWNVKMVDQIWYQQVIESLLTNDSCVIELKTALSNNSVLLSRIVRQHPRAFLIQLVDTLTFSDKTEILQAITKIEKQLASWPKYQQLIGQQIWIQIFEMAATGAPILPLLTTSGKQVKSAIAALTVNKERAPFSIAREQKIINELIVTLKVNTHIDEIKPHQQVLSSSNDLPRYPTSAIESAIEEKALKRFITHDGIFVQHAGLVLVHPFLNTLFKQIGLLNEKQFKDITAQEKAVYLLHFIATGSTKAEEHELAVPKILCGYPLELPINIGVGLSRKEKKEAVNMLEAAIASWDIFKRTSPDGLREGFLQRDGKFALHDKKIMIYIEKGAIDMLLDYLPWNLSIIKLPWLDEILNVEWR